MAGSSQRPAVFLDVDGPLIPFGPTDTRVSPPRRTRLADGGLPSNPLLDRLDPRHGALLAALPCDLVWATTWMQEANVSVAPRLGLPPLPLVNWLEFEQQDAWYGLHWKTRSLVAHAGARPFAWIDDEITDADRTWVSTHHQGPALLHRVDPRRGLTNADFSALNQWVRSTGTSTREPSADRRLGLP